MGLYLEVSTVLWLVAGLYLLGGLYTFFRAFRGLAADREWRSMVWHRKVAVTTSVLLLTLVLWPLIAIYEMADH